MSILLLALFCVCLLQSTVAHRVAIGGVQPDLFLVLAFAVSLTAGPELATAGAFLIGLYQDSLSGAPIGLNAFTLSLIAFLVSRLSRQMKMAELPARLALLFLAGVASGLTTLFVLRFFQVFRPFASTLLWTVLPGALYTAVLGTALLALPRLWGMRGLDR